ncbi:hypothetical protein EON82_11025 [bacterium]|nr:MAG: hypothetical protein EON82_11025 [bacterium]
MVKSILEILGLTSLAFGQQVGKYNPSPAQWIEIPVPPKVRAADRAVWDYAGNYSKLDWRVRRVEHMVHAKLVKERRRAPISLSVEGGTIVAINRGEWGGKLLFRPKGSKREIVVSKDQVVAFVQLPGVLYAVEGLAHLSISRGSIIRIDKTPGGWKTVRIAKLPAAPYAATIRSDGSLIITLSDGVVAYDARQGLRRIVGDAPWSGLYPNSSALAADGRHLYVGMRQYVAEVNLATRRVRMLVPSRAFLNRLSPSEERSVRARFVY